MRPVADIDDAIALIVAHEGSAEEFALPISDNLLDPAGVNMAVITDRILERGWEPDGFLQKDGYRLYRYKTA
jgi:hypothetical protein